MHLTDYPRLDDIRFDAGLVEEMDFLQDLCSAGKFIREEKNLRNRLPLSSLTLIGHNLSAAYQDIVKDELNVKEVKFDNNLQAYADKKIYLTASVEERAQRRYKELCEKGEKCVLEEIEKDIMARDEQDMNREIAPLKKAEDAILLDSSDMTIDQVVERIIQIYKEN